MKLVKKIKLSDNRRVFLFCTPLSGNLGDHAITEAEKYFLAANFKDINLCEIPVMFTDTLIKTVKRYISDKDLIIIQGGGFMGDIWFSEEEALRKVISEFPSNNIVIFPQTIHYSDTETGKSELDNSIKIYSQHRNLYIFARERLSYERMISLYKNNHIFLCPDMVLYGGFHVGKYDRNGILLCLRCDKESDISASFKDKLYQSIRQSGKKITCTDTVIDRYLAIGERETYITDKLREFSRAELIITDRLHGMIFSAITGTPCIVFDNNNHKVRGVYDWIKDFEYITLAEQTDDLLSAVKNLTGKCRQYNYNEEAMRIKFNPLNKLLAELLNDITCNRYEAEEYAGDSYV